MLVRPTKKENTLTDNTDEHKTAKKRRKLVSVEIYTRVGIIEERQTTTTIGRYTFCKYIRIESFNLPLTISNLAICVNNSTQKCTTKTLYAGHPNRNTIYEMGNIEIIIELHTI